MKILGILFAAILIAVTNVKAQIKMETIEYQHNGAALEGYLAYDESLKGKRPGILIIHEWDGPGDYVRMRAEQLAGLGYVAFAIDMYGKGVRPTTAQEKSAQASIYRSDRKLMRARAQAGLDQLRQSSYVDNSKIAAIGYCFGGGCALELARSGADLAGVVSFHGNLDTPDSMDAGNIKGRILVLHGASDPYVPQAQVEAFKKEMTDAGVDWELISYGAAVHGFSNPKNGNDPSQGAAYNEKADKRSWKDMQAFFDDIFK